MPNSERVALILTEAVVGPQIWQHGICDTMPDDEYELTKLAAVAVLELACRAIDWPRLLADAEARHYRLHRGATPTDYGAMAQPTNRDVCGECLREALLAHGFTGHSQDWGAEPKVTRRAGHLDWPQVFADVIKHRRPGYVERLHARQRELDGHQMPKPPCEACGKRPGEYGGSPGDGNLCSPCYDAAIAGELAWDGEPR
jgi:hypothetical protein